MGKKQLEGGGINQDQYNKFISNVDVAEQKEQHGTLLKDFATFQQSREKITKEYNDKINKMNEANAKAAEKVKLLYFLPEISRKQNANSKKPMTIWIR